MAILGSAHDGNRVGELCEPFQHGSESAVSMLTIAKLNPVLVDPSTGNLGDAIECRNARVGEAAPRSA